MSATASGRAKPVAPLLFCAWIYIGFFYSSSISGQEFNRLGEVTGIAMPNGTRGIGAADFNSDHFTDVFIIANAVYDPQDESSWSRLFKNNGNGTFSDVTPEAGLDAGRPGFGLQKGASWADFNNDGFPDLMIVCDFGIQLFENRGDGTFTDLTDSVGISTSLPCYFNSGLWWDYNNDGALDIFLSGHNTCTGNSAYRNEGGAVFTNVTGELGLEINGFSYMTIPLDVNGDGWTDLYTAVDYGINQLFVSDSGVHFRDRAPEYNLNSGGNDMGLTIGDYNLDGLFDLFITDINVNSLYRRIPGGAFTDVALEMGVKATNWSWETRFADFDLDTDEDLFIVNGYEGAKFNNYFFRNDFSDQAGKFSDQSEASGLGENTLSECFESFDYDNDGDLDILLSMATGTEGPRFYNNQVNEYDREGGSHFVEIALEGTVSNRNGFGATVEIRYQGKRQIRYHHGVGLYSQSILPVHFGLDTVSGVDTLLVRWPSGITDTLKSLDVNTLYEVVENTGYNVIDAPVGKKKGCMDPASCSFDPEATQHDPSLCTYLPGGAISGNIISGPLEKETYQYTGIEGEVSYWTVGNGKILEGQGTNTITVVWGIAEKGTLSVHEVSECYGETVSRDVFLGMDRISEDHSVARLWNEALLQAIREDYARPTVHARNLFHTAVAMYDSWAVYDPEAMPYLLGNRVGDFTCEFQGFETDVDPEQACNTTLSYAAYRLLMHRFANAPDAATTLGRFRLIMEQLGYDTTFVDTDYTTGDPAALGNYIGQGVIDFGYQDGSREQSGYDNAIYQPVNPPLVPVIPGNPDLEDPDRWQPLQLKAFIDQSGHLIEGTTPHFLSPEWGWVTAFSLKEEDASVRNQFKMYLDPGSPPCIGDEDGGEAYKWGFTLVSVWAGQLDPRDSVIWDISPGSIGNVGLDRLPRTVAEYPSFYSLTGGDPGTGRELNPVTNEPYEPQLVPRGDYTRVLAEFWADGPDSETPPGHWFTILNYVSDHPLFEKKFGGVGETMDPLEWDVKSYFALGGAMHDAAVTAWGIKGAYDYIRPISAIRYLAGLGQCSDPNLDNYNEAGIPLVSGYIEVVTEEDPLAGDSLENVGKIKLYTWRGHDYVEDPATDQAGVGWILAENWWPYQRPSFVTPPFAGYISGHSTYSRAAAEMMTHLTGDPYFPGGYGEFLAPRNEFLVFEEGPSVDVKIRWATYTDASDQCSLSRIWGGIHPPQDDIPGRLIGEKIGHSAFELALKYFTGSTGVDRNGRFFEPGGIYPNPVRSGDAIHVQSTRRGQIFRLMDLQGRILPLKTGNFSESNRTTVLHPGELPPGLYILVSGTRGWKLVVE